MTAALEELRQRDQWVLWRIVTRGGKPTKVPFQPNGKEAASNKPATWSSHAAVAELADRYDGVGYMFGADDPYTGVDIDKALTDSGDLHPAAAAIIKALDSYTEWSPSSTGAHVWVRARKPDGSRSRTKKTPWREPLEVYDRLRFFAITGNAIQAMPDAIMDRQAEIEALLEQYMPSRNGASSNGSAGGKGPGNTGAKSRPHAVEVDRDLVDRTLAEHPGFETLSARVCDDPSSGDHALCCAARRDGLEADVIEQLLAHRLERHGDPKGKRRRLDYIPNTVANAIAEVDRAQRDEEIGDPLKAASEIIGMGETPIVAAEERRSGRVILTRQDGRVLRAGSLESLAKYDRLYAAVGAAFGHEVKVTGAKGEAAVRFVSALRRHFGPGYVRTLEELVEEWLTELVRAADEVDFTAGEEKATVWQDIADTDPDDAKTARGFAEKVLLARDTATGDRYLLASWAQEYLRRRGWRNGLEEAVDMLLAVGLEQPNSDGRVKGGTIQMRFWVIPPALFGRWTA